VTDLERAEDIEAIVGVARHPDLHYGRAVSAERRVYILHSAACRASGIDLRDCDFSLSLDLGIDRAKWQEDVPVVLSIARDGEILPAPRCSSCTRPGDQGQNSAMNRTLAPGFSGAPPCGS
jgi:hypothetical protein